jgi:hypothetical protein
MTFRNAAGPSSFADESGICGSTLGEGPRTIDLGSGQFLLYAPKKAGGARVKAGAVKAAITG